MFARLLFAVLLATAGNVTVAGVYPNPATPGDAGEYVVLDVPDGGGTGLTLTDGEDSVELESLPPGRIAVTADPALVRNRTDLRVHAVNESLSLRNGGEWVALRRDGETISNLSYPRAPEAERYEDGTWTPPGRSAFDPLSVRNVSTTAFLLPDSSEHIEERLAAADQRILLGGYTFSDPGVTNHLLAAHRRGVDVSVLLEGGPVGGISTAEVAAVEHLRSAGIPVRFVGGDRARYAYHHAKYAVVDDSVLVASENWKPGGTGGHGSRGWGVVIHGPELAQEAADIFHADSEGTDARGWNQSKPADPVPVTPDNGTYPARFQHTRFEANRTTLVIAPDNAERSVRSLLESADTTVRLQQVSIQRDGVLIQETLAAARRGVSVRILVSGAWFVERENRRFVSWVRRTARQEDLPIEARVVEPRRRFEYVHAKGVIVDRESVLVGSLNWNDHALRENRELAVRIDDRQAAAYFIRTFEADWRGAAWRVHWSLVSGVLLALLGGVGFASRRIRFE